jgi:hypothetical protein
MAAESNVTVIVVILGLVAGLTLNPTVDRLV